MNKASGQDDGRAQIFKPKPGASAYELGGHGGAAAERPRPSQPSGPSRPQAKAQAPASQGQGQALAETVVSAMVERMTQLAESKGGTLTVEDIKGLGEQFQQQTTALSAVFEQTLEQTAKAASGVNWDQARKAPFDRIVVKTFSHLFADGSQLKDQKKGISRRMLPGFFLALNMMLGEEQVNTLQDRCRDILDRLRGEKGDAFNWDHFYADPEACQVVVDALITMAMYFENLGRRETWFIDLVNSNLSPASDPKSAAAQWQLTSPTFYRLLGAIFAGVRKKLDSEDRPKLMERHGNEKIAKLEGILSVIEGRG